jgi:hypothetical protein
LNAIKDNPIKAFQDRTRVENILGHRAIRNSTIVKDCYKLAQEYCQAACQSIESLPENRRRFLSTNWLNSWSGVLAVHSPFS